MGETQHIPLSELAAALVPGGDEAEQADEETRNLVQTEEVFLYDRHRERIVPATLMVGVPQRQMVETHLHWEAQIESARDRLKTLGEPIPEHLEWDWQFKAELFGNRAGNQTFRIECEGVLQGMLIASANGHKCIAPSQAGEPLLYLEYLSTAPTNLKVCVDEPRFRLVGKVLMAAAITYSDWLGYDGRIGLHSLRSSESFYSEACGMSDLGYPVKGEPYRYFEMTPDQAGRFLAGGEQE